MATCPYCSSELPENAKFCTNCGAPLNSSPSASEASLPEEPQYPTVDYPESLVSDQEPAARPAEQQIYTAPLPAVTPVNTTGLLIWAIITALFSLLPGIVAIIQTTAINKQTTVEAQQQKMKSAKIWCIVGTVIGILVIIGRCGASM